MKRNLTLALVVVAMCLLPGVAHAWFDRGHEQIADIAWTRLSPHAKREVAAMLQAGDPKFRPRDKSALAVRHAFDLAATFPDDIKTDTHTLYEPLIGPMNRRFQPGLDTNTADREAVRCKTWHYYDTPIRYRGTRPTVRPSNALAALGDARRQLAALELVPRPDRERECWWLYWVEHLTGDLHQPLHCATSYQTGPEGDAGGNRFGLGIPNPERPGKMLSLHAYWDGGIERAVQGKKTQGSPETIEEVTRRWVNDGAVTPARGAVRDLDVQDWIAAGAKLAAAAVYSGIQEGGVPSPAYRARQARVCERQAVLAGERLAALLNAICR